LVILREGRRPIARRRPHLPVGAGVQESAIFGVVLDESVCDIPLLAERADGVQLDDATHPGVASTAVEEDTMAVVSFNDAAALATT